MEEIYILQIFSQVRTGRRTPDGEVELTGWAVVRVATHVILPSHRIEEACLVGIVGS